MRKTLIAAALAALVLPILPATLSAGTIETACNRSDRPGATRGLCGCVQRAADAHLTRADQRLAARFFRDPERAQQVRMSDSSRDRAFWERYRAFVATAEVACAR
jgi:hypothetical protein